MYVYFVGGHYSKSYSRACLFLLPRHDSRSLLCNPNTPYSGGWNSTSLWHGWALQILYIDRSQESFLPGLMELNHICVPYRIHAKRPLCRLLNSLYIFFLPYFVSKNRPTLASPNFNICPLNSVRLLCCAWVSAACVMTWKMPLHGKSGLL